jgi:hypothetical protein
MPYPPRTTVFENGFQANPRAAQTPLRSGRTRLAGTGCRCKARTVRATTTATVGVPSAGFSTAGREIKIREADCFLPSAVRRIRNGRRGSTSDFPEVSTRLADINPNNCRGSDSCPAQTERKSSAASRAGSRQNRIPCQPQVDRLGISSEVLYAREGEGTPRIAAGLSIELNAPEVAAPAPAMLAVSPDHVV